jgi:hypothetical protein
VTQRQVNHQLDVKEDAERVEVFCKGSWTCSAEAVKNEMSATERTAVRRVLLGVWIVSLLVTIQALMPGTLIIFGFLFGLMHVFMQLSADYTGPLRTGTVLAGGLGLIIGILTLFIPAWIPFAAALGGWIYLKR